MAKDIFRRIQKENSNINMAFTAEICNETLIMIEDLCLEIAKKLLDQLGMPSPNQFAAVLFNYELCHQQNYNT
ncbi:hypothetical protein LOAG_19228, partial [Loa loa]